MNRTRTCTAITLPLLIAGAGLGLLTGNPEANTHETCPAGHTAEHRQITHTVTTDTPTTQTITICHTP